MHVLHLPDVPLHLLHVLQPMEAILAPCVLHLLDILHPMEAIMAPSVLNLKRMSVLDIRAEHLRAAGGLTRNTIVETIK